MILRQSTAVSILIGPILDAAGAAVTSVVVGSLKLTKNGVVGTLNASATLEHSHYGKHVLALTTSDIDTLGSLQISLNDSVNDMPVVSANVVTQAAYDALFAESGGAIPLLENLIDGVPLSKLLQILMSSAVGKTVRRESEIDFLARDGETVLATLGFNPDLPGEITSSTIIDGSE